MKSKDYLKQIAESKGVCPLTNEVKDNVLLFPVGFKNIFQDLERLEQLEKENQELKDENSLINKNKEVKLSEIIQVLDNAGFNKNFIKKKQESYNKFDKKLVEHIEVWNGIFFVKVIDIWNGKIESIDLNATEPAFSKIFHWASIQANIINDLGEEYLSSQKK